MVNTYCVAKRETHPILSCATKAICLCFTLLILLILFVKISFMFQLLPTVLAVMGILALILLVAMAIYLRKALCNAVMRVLAWLDRHLTAKRAILILVVLSLGSKLLSIALLGINSLGHPDINTYVVTAKELFRYGEAKTYATYCWHFSHMYWYAVFLMPVVGVCGMNATAISIYLSLISTVSIVLLFDTTRKYLPTAVSFVIFALFSLLPGQILLPSFVTHEHALLFFLSITVWIIFKVIPDIKKERKALRFFLHIISIIALFWATQMNAAALVAVIALCIVYFLKGLEERSWRAIGVAVSKCILLVTVIVIGSNVCSAYQAAHSSLTDYTIKTNKLIWTLYVGSNTETAGQWSIEDVETFDDYSSDFSSEQIATYHKNLLVGRYELLLHDPARIGNLLTDKFSTIWSSFLYPISYANETAQESARMIYNRVLFKPLACLEYGVSVLLTVVFIFSMMEHRKREQSLFWVFIQLFIMGTTAMLLLTECSNKYTIALQPFYVIICLGTCPYDGFESRIKSK